MENTNNEIVAEVVSILQDKQAWKGAYDFLTKDWNLRDAFDGFVEGFKDTACYPWMVAYGARRYATVECKGREPNKSYLAGMLGGGVTGGLSFLASIGAIAACPQVVLPAAVATNAVSGLYEATRAGYLDAVVDTV
ncbi:hypothetical protein KY328_00690 [Candidatus Woesearchaeota archaeon]|nr:hypothetical protein [Candidatus Woesearchaeota archaeon]MBW3021414.1 hypothetical protein [Candidatus Woesearchaeota archaeon]